MSSSVPGGTLGGLYVFTSHYLWTDPRLLIEASGITNLPVFYNTDKMKDYMVDVEELDEVYQRQDHSFIILSGMIPGQP